MSEFHPSRPPLVRTKSALRIRKFVEGWPLLVWLAMAGLAWGIHSRGVTFNRMNGAVDVNHQYVTPPEDGVLARILVEQGQVVEAGTVVAEMDSRALRHQLNALLLGASATRREEVLRLDRIRIDLESELRGYAVAVAEGNGRLGPLQRFLNQSGTPAARSGSTGLNLGRVSLFPGDRVALESEIGEITSRVEVIHENISSVEKELEKVAETLAKLEKDLPVPEPPDDNISPELMAALTEAERAELLEINALIDASRLRAARRGIVDRIDRNEGEYVAAGESILQVVAETGKIVGFLPQAHLGKLQQGDPVWITPAYERDAVYESTVINISPRITGLLDASSPLPNQRIYGRNVTIRMPDAGDGMPPLSPGQTVVIHTSRPGEIPVLNRLFPVDIPAR